MDEAAQVIHTISCHGIIRKSDTETTGIKVCMLCEIPSNIILIDEFAPLFDGFLIGSNDLTQLTLGHDINSKVVTADIFDVRNPAVLKLIEMAIIGAKRNHKQVGICGQLPSDCPEVIEMLIRLGANSICIAVENFMTTLSLIQKYEVAELGWKVIVG
jgi:pyruvate,water dikinase